MFFSHPIVLGVTSTLIEGALVIVLSKLGNFFLAKKTIIDKCRNTNYFLKRLTYKDFSIDPKTYNPYFKEWELSRLLYNSIFGGNKLIIITGKSRTGKTRAVFETLKNLRIDNKDKYIKKLQDYIFISPSLELLKSPESRKYIPRNLLFCKKNFIIFFDDVLNLEYRGANITNFVNDFFGKYNDVIVIMSHSKEDLITTNIDLYYFLEKYRKEIKPINLKFNENYLNENIIEVPDVSLQLLFEINDNLGDAKKTKDYIVDNYDRTIQPLFYSDSTSYSSFNKLEKDEQKILYSSKLILYFGGFPFKKELLFRVFSSKIFNGCKVGFENKLKKLISLKFINECKDNNYFYVDPGILSRALRDYPFKNKFSKSDISIYLGICIDLRELGRIIFMARKLYMNMQIDESINLLKETDNRIKDNVNIMLELGMQLKTVDRYKEVIEVLERLVKIDNTINLAWAMLSDSYLYIGDYSKSNMATKKAIKYGMNDPIIWYNYGNVLTFENKHRDAENAFRKAIALNKYDKATWFNLGNSLRLQGKYVESERAYREAIKIDSNYFNALVNLSTVLEAQRKFDEAIETLEKIPKTHPGYELVKWDLEGVKSRRQNGKNWLEKEKELLIKLDKKNKNDWYELIISYLGSNNFGQVENYTKRAINIFKYNDGFYNILAISLYFQKRYEEANEAFEKSKIKDCRSYLVWADTLKIIKEYYKAHRMYIKALILDKNKKETWYDMALNFSEQKKYKISIMALLKAIEIDNRFARAHNALGACFSYINDLKNSEKEFKKAIEIDNKFILAWSNLGELYFGQKRYEEAVEALEKAFGFIEENDKKLVKCLKILGKDEESKKFEGIMRLIIYKDLRDFL